MVTFDQHSGRKRHLNENNTGTCNAINQENREPECNAQPLAGAALQIARGVCRHFRALNRAVLLEVPLADGRRCDVMALDERGDIVIVEIKSCAADFRGDDKWSDYRQWCDRFYFAVLSEFPQDLIPEDCGLILADRFGAECVRESMEHRLNAPRRKALTLRFARCSAFRLQDVGDPSGQSIISG